MYLLPTARPLLRILIVLLPFAFSACIASPNDHPYPSDWPDISSAPAKCEDVAATYTDPNLTIWDSKTVGGVTSGTVKTVEKAWLVFGFRELSGTSLDPKIKSRTFSISFSADRSLLITYFIDGNLVLSKSIPVAEYTCDRGRLSFVTYQRKGDQIYDMFPNHGVMVNKVSILRSSDYLYVKESNMVQAFFFGFIPAGQAGSWWQRFPVQMP